MDRKIITFILIGTLFALGIGLMIPGGESARTVRNLPWEIELLPDGGTRVFNLTLGRSTLSDAQAVVGDEPELNLFLREDGSYTVEAYFESVWMSGLKASMVASLEAPERELEAMFKRGLRITKVPSGSNRITLTKEDGQTLAGAPIGVITYLPATKLDEELLVKHFGQPAERLTEAEGGTLHLLYPERGLDIARDPDGRTVMQYLLPAHFAAATAPLHAQPAASTKGEGQAPAQEGN